MGKPPGEFELIRRMRRVLGAPHAVPPVPLGDDCAAVPMKDGHLCLLTTDAMVQGVHFDLQYMNWGDVGWKAMAANVSDIAAMGGRPLWAMVSLGIQKSMSSGDVEDLYRGMRECSRAFHFSIIGGDTVHAPHEAFVSVAMTGEVEPSRLCRRSGAQPGDRICVSGELGGSLVGFRLLSTGSRTDHYPRSIQRFLHPRPRLELARWLSEQGGVTSMIDVSDGLSSEIHHLCEASHLGCRILRETIPGSRELKQWAETGSWVSYALGSGEEYELLFTVQPSFDIDAARRNNPGCLPLTVLGEMTASRGMWVENGKKSRLERTGWDHFQT